MEISQSNKTAILFGATGLVGHKVLHVLLRHPAYTRVKAFGRRKIDLQHDKLEQHVIDFDRLGPYSALFSGHDVFSCLGTTMAKAGSKEAFYRVDFTYAVSTARICAEQGCRQVAMVSALGADEDSLFYYNRVKAEVETAIMDLPFWATHIFRPSVLDGDRKEFRLGEALSARLLRGADFLTGGRFLGKFRPIEDQIVARAMVASCQGLQAGKHVYENEDIFSWAEHITALPSK